MVKHVEEYGADAVDAARKRTRGRRDRVPGPSSDPETNLIMADVAMRAGTTILRSAVEKGFLKGRYGSETASEIVSNRSVKKTLTSFALAKLATRSLPGAVLVSGGMLAKTLFDKGRARRARLRGDRRLREQAKND